MAKAKRKSSGPDMEQANDKLDDVSAFEKRDVAHEPKSGEENHEQMEDHLRDRHGSPINTPPKGMDA